MHIGLNKSDSGHTIEISTHISGFALSLVTYDSILKHEPSQLPLSLSPIKSFTFSYFKMKQNETKQNKKNKQTNKRIYNWMFNEVYFVRV